jgi:hypothetical protein
VAKDPAAKDAGKDQPTPQASVASTPAPEQAQRQLVQVDATKANAAYANFCRVTGTPEELIIDFGLNTQPMGVPTDPINVTQRIVMNYYTAKRMMTALSMSLQRHEAAFGVLETDVQKRLQPGVLRQPAAAAK